MRLPYSALAPLVYRNGIRKWGRKMKYDIYEIQIVYLCNKYEQIYGGGVLTLINKVKRKYSKYTT